MIIVYNDWIVNYHKDWRAYTPQIWRDAFGPVILTTTKTLPSACVWIVPGTEKP